jgi:hypothetical protein
VNTAHFLQQLSPRAWARQTLDQVRDGVQLPPSTVERALQHSGDLPMLSTGDLRDECEHDYEVFQDYEGDPSLYQGTRTFWIHRCVICGDEYEGPAPGPDDDDDIDRHLDR